MKRFGIVLNLLLLSLFVEVSAQKTTIDINNISLPKLDWSMSINLSDFNVKKNNISLDCLSRKIMGVNPTTGLNISIFIEKADHSGDSKECREFYWSKAEKSPLPKDNLTKSEKGNIAIVEHDIKEYQGKTINFHNLNAYISHEGFWIDVHISKIGYKNEDKALFDAIINSIEFKKPKTRNMTELLIYGNQAYMMKDYKEAISTFEQILETEKSGINMEKTMWLVVVDNLGMAYGISGDLDNSKRVFEYGIKLDPEYPNFYYSLACTYAEMSDLENSLKNLETAYNKKENVIPGETLPNPKTDSSFKKYLNDKQFKQFIKDHKL